VEILRVELSEKKTIKYLKDKINELETKSKNKDIRGLYRGINEFEKGYQPRTDIEKDENVCLQILTIV